ncbi:class I SAM-dependent methyltransferase [Pseudonocardia sp. KRD291]|uniref:class I SAM-dependent methyltransferase n=1 Tax=Pseudonocardia sp. KRD291 TaxID=2792007 RepID=UPI001C4A23D2|nr:class I SAM-dependent methyltransferase [Pseudonocardia sp. KRD291]MBW0104585.1 class I SAM-dependent methyltransferase [Pseudonocardia sp. KRD291]
MAHDPADVPADPSNADQLRSWDGDGGAYWAEHATRYDEGVAAYRPHFCTAAAIGHADAVLDIGCGAGQTTRDAARAAAGGSALGVDLSARLLELARRLAERDGLHNAAFRRADAQNHPFDAGSFDVAISRTGAMFFGDPAAAFANVARALRPDGRLVLMTWQPLARQEWLRSYFGALAAGRDVAPPPSGAPGPFALDEPGHVRDLLGRSGFTGVALTGVDEPMYVGPDADDATRFILGQFAGLLDGLGDDDRARATDELHHVMSAHLTDRGVLFDSAVWLVETRRA